ncbi:glycosyltransferase [Paenibacillus sp. KN14-4R]|uniref:glycosyltransferase n=1 Tax=Paenibacillus sp. KN14-4R TaxID=3445773 RepID=UPI003FA01ACC
MKVLMLVSRLNTGGTEKYILSVSRYLISKGFQVGVATRRGPLLKSFIQAGIKVHFLPPRKKSLATQVSSLSSIVTKGRYKVVHAHDSKSFRHAAILHHQLKIPFIATIHGTYHTQFALKEMSKVAKRLIVVSPQLSSWLVRQIHIPAKKIRMIPNGINTLVFHTFSIKKKWRKVLSLPQSAQILVYAGRFSRDKIQIAKKVILASEIVARNNPNFVAVLFGPGTYAMRSKLLALAAKVNGRLGRQAIYIRHALSDIQHAYFAGDVIVGTGRVALEGMACARPVIAAGVAGYCGLIKPKNLNKIVRAHFGDHGALEATTIGKLSDDISKLLNTPKKARFLGKFGARTVRKRFSIEKIGNELIRVYGNL